MYFQSFEEYGELNINFFVNQKQTFSPLNFGSDFYLVSEILSNWLS